MPNSNDLSPDVILVSMPFGPISQPALGLTLLKGVLHQHAISATIMYPTIKFAEMIGDTTYRRIVSGDPYVDLAGEWIFSNALFEGKNSKHADYVNDVLHRKSDLNIRRAPVHDAYVKNLQIAYAQVDQFLEIVADDVLAQHSRIVGLTSTFQQHTASLGLAKLLKARCPDLFIVIGGGNCEGIMGIETIRQFAFVDAVVSGEGENIFPELVKNVLASDSIDMLPGVFTQSNVDQANPMGAPMVCDLDALPIPDYSDFFEQLEQSTLPKQPNARILFETSRGCWWGEHSQCTFCGLNGKTMMYRSKSSTRAINELISLLRCYPDLPIWVVDNIMDMKYLNDFIPNLSGIEGDLELFFEVKANLSKEQLVLLREGNVKHLQPGLESLNDHVLKLMRKGTTWLQNVQILKWGKELGINIYWNILWGLPGETPEDYEQMVNIIPMLHHLVPPISLSQIRLDRFSPYFDDIDLSDKFVNVRPAIPYQYIYPFETSVLANLAYHFFFDYRDTHDPASYTPPLVESVKQWRNVYRASDLIVIDLETHLLIWDFRSVATQVLTILSGIQRLLYLHCDKSRSRRQLEKFIETHTGSIAQLDELLSPLVEGKLMVRYRNTYLSLAIRLGSHRPTLIVMQKLKEAALKTELILDDSVPFNPRTRPILDNRFFGLNPDGTPKVYYEALCILIDWIINKQLTTQPKQTIAGITIDM